MLATLYMYIVIPSLVWPDLPFIIIGGREGGIRTVGKVWPRETTVIPTYFNRPRQGVVLLLPAPTLGWLARTGRLEDGITTRYHDKMIVEE